MLGPHLGTSGLYDGTTPSVWTKERPPSCEPVDGGTCDVDRPIRKGKGNAGDVGEGKLPLPLPSSCEPEGGETCDVERPIKKGRGNAGGVGEGKLLLPSLAVPISRNDVLGW